MKRAASVHAGAGARVTFESLQPVGTGLHRPECVLCTEAGDLFVADWRGGVLRIGADGSQRAILATRGAASLQPNGIALQPDGSFLLANLGVQGGVWRLQRSGELEPYVLEVEGVELPPCNFVVTDEQRRTWITVSTRQRPRALGYRGNVADGFIVLVDERGARIVADGLGYTNEVAVGDGVLYANETFGRRLSRFRLHSGGALGPRETVTQFGAGTFPDGVCLDVEGSLWVTSIVSNRVIRVSPKGEQELILEESDPQHVLQTERAFASGMLESRDLASVGRARLGNLSSLAFGGADRRTAFLGCLLDDRLFSFRAPVAGRVPAHWRWA